MVHLIPKATAAGTGVFYFHREHIGCRLVVDGALGASTIPILFVGADGTTTTEMFDSAGSAVELTATNTDFEITSAGKLSLTKGVTVAAAGVMIHGLG